MIHLLYLLPILFGSSLGAIVLEDLIASNSLTETLEGKKLGYYTGSFDPVHGGHEAFAKGVIESGLCDYVLVVPAWGGDEIKSRVSVSFRLDMLFALFAGDPQVIVTRLSPLNIQRALTKEFPDDTIRGYPTVRPRAKNLTLFGLIGSDTALNLGIPTDNKQTEALRKKHLQVFMRGVSIPEKYAQATIGSIMALPVSQFIVGLRNGDDLEVLDGRVGDRLIASVYQHRCTDYASSTLVKQRLKNGESVDNLLDPAVLEIILKHNLYTSVPQ